MQFPTTLKGWLTIVLALIAAATGVVITVSGGDHSTTVSVTVQTPAGPTQVTAATSAVDQAASGDHNDLGATSTAGDLALAKTAGVTSAQIAVGVKQVTALRGTLPTSPLPATATSMPGCVDRFLKTNYSSRGGVAPRLVVWHLTESPDSGWSGINGNIAWFSNPGAQVSIHFLVDGTQGHCAYTLPMSLKAWQVVGYNSLSVGIEKTGNESNGYYVKGAGRTRLEVLTARIAHAWHIPIRRGAVGPGCPQIRRTGIVDHAQLGQCGGGHDDINPYRAEIPGLIHGTKVWYDRLYSNHTAARCNELKALRTIAAHRRHVHRKPYWTAHRKALAGQLKHELGSKAASCR